MRQNRIYSLLAFIASSFFLFTACTKTQSSTDTPLSTAYTPSVIIGSDNYSIISLDLVAGSKIWTAGFYGAIVASPIVYNEKAYIIPNNSNSFNSDTIYKLDSRTGVLVNKFVLRNGNIPLLDTATPIAVGNMLYVAGCNDSLYAIDTGTGHIYWAFEADGQLFSSPTYYPGNGDLYFASKNGTVYCLNATTGTLIWSYTIANAGTYGFFSSPCWSNGNSLFIGCTDSNLYKFTLNSPTAPAGNLVGTYKTGGPVYSSPTVAGPFVIFGSEDDSVHCLDTTYLGRYWSTMTGDHVNSSPYYSTAQQMVFVGSNDYYLYALNVSNGSVRWKFATTGFVSSSPLAYGPFVYFGSNDRNIYAADSASGTMQWKYNLNGNMEWCSPTIDNLTTNQLNSSLSGYTQ